MKRDLRYEGLSRVVVWVLMARDAGFDARVLARRCDVSERQLERIFERELASVPKPWLNEQRMVAARRLLASAESIKQVAFELGYKHPTHFCRDFKQCYEMTPREFQTRIYHR